MVGHWTFRDPYGNSARLVLEADGSCELAGMRGQWQMQGDILVLAGAGAMLAFHAAPSGDQLVLTAVSGLEPPIVLTREPAATVATAPPAPPAPPAAPSSPPEPHAPRFKSATRTVADPGGRFSFTVPEGWSFAPGESGAVRYAKVATTTTGIVNHELTYWQIPIPPAEMELDLPARVARGAAQVDQLFAGLERRGVRYLDAPRGQIARFDYDGWLTNAHGRQAVVGLCAATQRGLYLMLATLVSAKQAAGELDDDVLAALDSIVLVTKERDPEAERALVGQWVIPSKSGTSFETMTFRADGTYRYHFESSHAGSIKNSYGDTTATWGTASQDDDAGRWQVRDDMVQLVGNKGERLQPFRIWRNNGKLYLRLGSATYVR